MKNIKFVKLEKGFSLVEMLVVLFILSVILLVIVPSFQQQKNSLEMSYFLKELEQDLYYYQMVAMTNGRSVRFVFYSNSPNYYVLDGARLIHEKQGPVGLKFIPRSLELNELRFTANGGILKAGRIEINLGGEKVHLVFHLLRGRFYFTEV
ncbi:competence type IV pilus minor pilin ComGD [Salipaludibacillus sp. HK11]|uniref:competence type IV pilus minor pilin ComGD n=1 Tax=Salipaludibacillus sp. HK11 TaxID=3394320 RepID=UPI0039FCDA56